MYIADTGNRVIRRVDPSGIIHLVAGIPESANSYYVGPRDIAMGPDGNLYIADSEPGYIIMSLPDGYGGRIAGTYHDFPSGQFDAVQAYDAKFLNPLGIAVDARGNVWIADTGHSRIRILFR